MYGASQAVACGIPRLVAGLDALVNNAGYGNVSPVEDTSLSDSRTSVTAVRAHYPDDIGRRASARLGARRRSREVRYRGPLGVIV
jgi:NAD(P)-dependent dehydrogenase (short-subunit alcohol dehydrogenase family)